VSQCFNPSSFVNEKQQKGSAKALWRFGLPIAYKAKFEVDRKTRVAKSIFISSCSR